MQNMRSKFNRKHKIIAVILIAIICAAITGTLSAKYIKDYFPVGSLILSVKLDEQVSIIEHKAERTATGAYKLTTEPVASNSYELMPGVDIPKDPQLVLEDKTAVPAYMYVEVVTTKPDTVTYELMPNWIRLGTVIGPNGGPVYVYSVDGTEASIVDNLTFPVKTQIKIIKDDKLYISHTVATGTNFTMNIYGYMAQAVKEDGAFKNAEVTFDEAF